MLRRSRLLVAAFALLTPALVLVAPASPAGAVDDDLQVSSASGAPGDVLEVSSASCIDDEDTFRFLQVRLVTGTAPDEVAAGLGGAFESDPAKIVIPDWVDPTAPAAVEAFCFEFDLTVEDELVAPTRAPYTPVAFDVLPGIGLPTQTRSFSRTSLLAGQGFTVAAEGCTIPDAAFTEVAVLEGLDLAGRTWDGQIGFGFGEEIDPSGAFESQTALVNGGVSISVTQINDDPPVVDHIDETPTDIPAGEHTVVVLCHSEDGASLMYEPAAIEVTGSAPTTSIELTADPVSREIELTGSGCTSETLEYMLSAVDLRQVFSDDLVGTPVQMARRAGRASFQPALAERAAASGGGGRVRVAGGAGATRALESDDPVFGITTPSGDGGWGVDEEVAFNGSGIAEGDAVCGDPFADGFYYDPQAVEIAVKPMTLERGEPTTTTPPAAPVAPGAGAIPGTPTFTG